MSVVFKPTITLISIPLIIVACGKKVNEPQVSLSDGSNEPIVPEKIELQVKNNKTKDIYKVKIPGAIKIPTELTANTNDYNSKVSITFNQINQDDWEIRCFYQGNIHDNNLIYTHCIDFDGRDLSLTEQMLIELTFMLFKETHIEMELIDQNEANLVVDFSLAVDWR